MLAGYRIDGELGEGGMGVVYRATQLSLERVVALKLLASELSNDPGFRARFQREGQLQAALDHQHIVTVYEAGQTEFGLFLAMRLIDGPTLKQVILDGELDPRRSLRLLAQAAQALDAAHALGLIHRDIKPQNILIGHGDHAYLADFGLIKAPDEAARLTDTGQFIGTIDYVAPEQIQGDPATVASDIYALTGVLYECLTGAVPFPKPSEAATIHAHVTEPPPRVTERRPELPAALDEVIARGMAKDPEARPSSATELIRVAARAFGSGGAPSPGAQETRLSRATGAHERPQLTYVSGQGQAALTVKTPAAPAGAAAGATRVAGAVAAPPVAAVARGRRVSGGVLVLVAALAAVASVAAGFVVGHRARSSQEASAFVNAATLGHLRLRYPSGWQLGASAAAVPGITFSSPLVLTPPQGNAALSAGEVSDAGGATLLSASFRGDLTGALPAAATVRIGALEGYRYSGLAVRGLDGALTLFAVPTTAGVATVTCWAAPHGPRGFQGQCAEIADTLALVGASAYPIGPSGAYASELSATFTTLNAASSAPSSALSTARTPAAQAAAARELASAYEKAASTLSKAKLSPAIQDANNALSSALATLATQYTAAATAAGAADSSAYARAGKRIQAAATALNQALAALSKQGYTLTKSYTAT